MNYSTLYQLRCLEIIHDSLHGAKSDCCAAPINRVKDDLLTCTACGNLCTERDLWTLPLREP